MSTTQQVPLEMTEEQQEQLAAKWAARKPLVRVKGGRQIARVEEALAHVRGGVLLERPIAASNTLTPRRYWSVTELEEVAQ